MTNISATWNTAAGEWFVPSNWNEPNPPLNDPPIVNYVPGANNDVILDNAGVTTPYTITYNPTAAFSGTDAVNSVNSVQEVTLAIQTGALTVLNAAGANSSVFAIDLSAGATLSLADDTFTVGGGVYAGTLSIGAGASLDLIQGAHTLTGAVSGAGALVFGVGSTLTLDTANIGVNQLEAKTALVSLGNDLTYAGTFTSSGGEVSLNGHTFTLSSVAAFGDGSNGFNVYGAGVLDLTGAATIGYSDNFDGGVTVHDANAVTQNGDIALNGATGATVTLDIAQGATYTIATAGAIIGNNFATVVNDGLLTDSAAGTSNIQGSFTNTGSLSVGAGATLSLATGVETIGGGVSGAGALAFGNGGTVTLDTATIGVNQLESIDGLVGLGADLTYAGALTSSGGAVSLDGHTLTLSGVASIGDGNDATNVHGSGKLDLTGATTLGYGDAFDAGVTVVDASAVTQNGAISLNGATGSLVSLDIVAGATYTIATAGSITGNNFTTVVNDGTLTDTAAGASHIQGNFSDAGSLSVGSGATLSLENGAETLSGGVSGAGTLAFGPFASAALNPSEVSVNELQVNGGSLSVNTDGTYAGTFFANGGSGAITLNGHNLTLTGAATIDDTIDMSSGSTLELDGAVAGSGQISFASAGPLATLRLDSAAAPANGGTFAPTLSNFGNDDALDLTGLTFVAGATATSSGSTLTVTSGAVTENFTLSNPGATTYYAYQDSGTGTIITDSSTAPCYVRGTRILTNRGEVAVEELRIGDFVVTASGALRPIRWIGHRKLDIACHRDPKAVRPVRVSPNAFGEGLPRRDLWLSPGHNVVSAGVLMPISCLINGRSVVQVEQDFVEYWHVELDAHDIVIAEGLQAESYLDTGNRTAFGNGGAFVEAHPDFMPRHWRDTCLPLVQEGPLVERTKARLLSRLCDAGHSIDQEADAHVVADGLRVEPIRLADARFAFLLENVAETIALRSKRFVPAHTVAESTDSRELGLCVAQLQIDGFPVALDSDADCASGWREAEFAEGRFTHRWTSGDTPLPGGVRVVIVDLAGAGYYWRSVKDRLAAAVG